MTQYAGLSGDGRPRDQIIKHFQQQGDIVDIVGGRVYSDDRVADAVHQPVDY